MDSSDTEADSRRVGDASLQTTRNNFFGIPQDTDESGPSHADCSIGTPVTTPRREDPSSSSSGAGMSAARKYFSVRNDDDSTADNRHNDHHTTNEEGERRKWEGDDAARATREAAVRFDSPLHDEADLSGKEAGDSDGERHGHHAGRSPNEGDRSPGQSVGLSDHEMIRNAIAEEQAILDSRPPPRQLTADEVQAARMRAYDETCGTSTWDFLRETAQAVVPDAVNHLVDHGTDAVVRTSEHIIPEGVRRAADAFGSAANTAGHAIEAVPKLVVGIIPSALMSDDTKKMLFGDFTNTLRSFYHTNVLSMPFVMNQAGLIGGILLLLVVSFTSEYATEAFFGAKNQLRDARKVVTYGDVPRMTWGAWYPSLNLFYGITHLIGFVAFSASNTRVLLATMGLTGGGAMAVSLIVPSVISLPLVFIKRDVDQKPYAVISSFIVFVSVICMFSYFPYSATSNIKLWADSASDYFVALGVAVYAFTGIGSCTPIERTMRPRRYVKCLRAAVGFSCAVLMAFGLSGFLSYGNRTCSVITVSLQPGAMKTAVSALLFVASIAIIPQQTFPLCELCDRRLLGIRHVPTYWELKPNLLRIGTLVISALAAWIVPYYGLLLSISGALGCGTVGIIVPAAMDYMRRARWGLREGRHLFWWEYLIVFGLGLYGCTVVIIGVTFGLYKLWITIQTNSSDTC